MKRCSLNARSEEQSGYSLLRSNSSSSFLTCAVKVNPVTCLLRSLPHLGGGRKQQKEVLDPKGAKDLR